MIQLPLEQCFIHSGCTPFYLTWFAISLAPFFYALYRFFRWYQSNKVPDRNRYVPIAIVIVLLESALYMMSSKLQNIYSSDTILQAATILVMLFTAAYPVNFVSNQSAYIRSLFRGVRQDYLYSQFSPFIRSKNLLNPMLTNRIKRFFAIANLTFYITIILLTGGIFIPVSIYLFSRIPWKTGWQSTLSPLQLLIIGLISIFIFMFVYFLVWLGKTRSRYIVTEFEIDNEDKNFKSELNSIAKLATHSLVDELQQIATLLKLRQVENLHFIREDSNAFFVTSGVDQEFFDQMQQVVSIEISNAGKLNLGGLINWFVRLLARIQVRGRVQRRTNNSVEIWVELKYRNNQSAAVGMVVLSENSLEEIDDVFIRPVARQLALKLLIELGQVPHLGSSWENLDYFLKGLDASANRNWWQAIAHYRKALQAEEAFQGSFGIGHYHLGTALLFQGNWKEGYEHLRTAEADGPPMAELQYMIALALLRVFGNLSQRFQGQNLRTRESEFWALKAMSNESNGEHRSKDQSGMLISGHQTGPPSTFQAKIAFGAGKESFNG